MVSAEEESGNRMAKGALVGAGTNVIGGAVLDSLDGSSQQQPQYVQVQGPDGQMYWQQVATPQEDPNKVILKRAVQGAVTGAVAAEFAKDDGKENKGSDSDAAESIADALTTKSSSENGEDDDSHGKKHKHKKSKEGWRPPGWDKGKKTGWEGGDEPPGLQKD